MTNKVPLLRHELLLRQWRMIRHLILDKWVRVKASTMFLRRQLKAFKRIRVEWSFAHRGRLALLRHFVSELNIYDRISCSSNWDGLLLPAKKRNWHRLRRTERQTEGGTKRKTDSGQQLSSGKFTSASGQQMVIECVDQVVLCRP